MTLCASFFFNSQHFGIKERDLSRTEFCEKCVRVVSMLSSWAFSKAVNCNERYNYQVSVKHFHSHFISHVLQSVQATEEIILLSSSHYQKPGACFISCFHLKIIAGGTSMTAAMKQHTTADVSPFSADATISACLDLIF